MARPADVVTGQRLGPYELVRELGRGGFASVWLARRAGKGGFQVDVAIKLARIELSTDPAFQKMFLDEARLAAQIRHPNVISIFELGEEGDLLYLVMEYVRGRPLNVLRNCAERAGVRVPVPIVMRVLADTCAGLHAAHELTKDGRPLGVIHRDVSPQNVLVSDKGVVKLIDFGVAKANDRLAAETTAGHAKGKLRYMAPEQALGRRVDRRADIWAVGAVAYDLIEGHGPFDGYNDLVRLFKLLDEQPAPAFTSDVAPPIAAVIERCLERDPENRFATAAELRVAIEDALERSHVRTTPEQVVEFFKPWLSDEDEDGTPSRSARLRARLKRGTGRASLQTIDLPPPDGDASARETQQTPPSGETPSRIETLSAVDTAALPKRTWRLPVAALAVVAVVAGGIGVLRPRGRVDDAAVGSVEAATQAAGGQPSASPPQSARERDQPVPPPAEPPRAPPAVSIAPASVPSSRASGQPPTDPPVASAQKSAHPPRATRKPAPPPPPTRRYDDTIN